MKNVVNIHINKNIKQPKYSLELSSFSNIDFELVIYNDGILSYDELISDKEAIEKAISSFKSYGDKLLGVDTSELSDSTNFFNTIDYISFNASKDEWSDEDNSLIYQEDLSDNEIVTIISEYLSNHKEYKKKKILLPNIIDVGTDIISLCDKYSDYKDVLVLSRSSYEPMPLNIVKKGSKLDQFIYDLKSLKLSPLEYAILVYDIVREKPYKCEKKGVLSSSSRETYQVLSGDDIVCLGYANIYSTILNHLGIKSSIVTLRGKKSDDVGHARNVLRINDKKYNVKGIFFVDPTMDSRNKYDYTKWLYTYHGFMQKKSYFRDSDASHGLHDKDFGYLDKFKPEDVNKLFELYNLNPVQVVIMGGSMQEKYSLARLYLKNILKLYEPINDETSNEEAMNIYKKYSDEIVEDLNSELYMSDFVRALIRVRYLEHKIAPFKYTFNIEQIYKHIPTFDFEYDRERIISSYKDLSQLASTIDEDKDKKEKELVISGLAKIVSEEVNAVKAQDVIGEIKVIKSIRLYNKKSYQKNRLNGNN